MTSKPTTKPAHIQTLIDNTIEVISLIGFHVVLTGKDSGRRHHVEILNKSALVLLVACWESFVEDVATQGFDFLLSEAKTPNAFPQSVLALSAKPLRESDDPRKLYELAGEGWRTVLRKHRQKVLEDYAGKLNTPKPKQVNDLIEKMIGLKGISSEWKWRGMPNNIRGKKLGAT